MLLYFIRFILSFFVFFIGSTIVVFLFVLGFVKTDRAYFYTRFLMPTLLKIYGIRVEVIGGDKLESHHPCVFIANHQHTLDLFVHGSMIPHRTITIGKKSLKWIPIFGWIFVLSDCILIDRSKRQSALDSMKEASREMNRKQISVWVFPEGTRSGSRGLLPFKKGAFHLAVQAGCPIVPIVNSSYHKCLNLKKWNSGTVRIEILEPISTKGLSEKDVASLMERAHQIMSSKLDELNLKS